MLLTFSLITSRWSMDDRPPVTGDLEQSSCNLHRQEEYVPDGCWSVIGVIIAPTEEAGIP